MPPTSSPPSEPGRESPGGHFLDRHRIPLQALAMGAASLLVLIPLYHLPLSNADEGIIATGAERILCGQVPYRDFFSELGPTSFYLQAVIFKIGAINVTALRLTAWLLGGAISGLIYLLARKIMGGLSALLATAVFSLICYPTAYRVSHHWWANLFLLLAVLSLAASLQRAPEASGSLRRGWLLLAGMLAAMTLLSLQPKGFWAIVTGVLFLAGEPRLRGRENRGMTYLLGLRQSGWFLIGATVTVGAAAGYFASRGALGDWIEDNLVFLFIHYRTYVDVPQASAYQTLVHVGKITLTHPSVRFFLYFVGYFFFFFVAPSIAFGGTAWQLVSAGRPWHGEARPLLLILLEGVGAFLSEYHSPDVFHVMSAAPLMLILVVHVWGLAISHSRLLRWPAKAAAIAAVGLVLFTAARKAVNTMRIDGRVATRRGVVYVQPSSAGELRGIVEGIQERVRPGGETFFFPYMAQLYFLTATRNPTRFDVLLPDFHSQAQINETIARLESARPDFIFSFDKIQRWTVRPHFPDDPPDVLNPHPIERWLSAPASGYRIAATTASGSDIAFYCALTGGEMEVWARKP
jgi:hypothetical protein